MSAVYENNIYYGIKVDYEHHDVVVDILEKHDRYNALTRETGGRVKVGKNRIYASYNTDGEDNTLPDPSIYYIFVDEMTISGSEGDEPHNSSVEFIPSECVKSESRNSVGVDTIIDIYNTVVAGLKERNLSPKLVYMGWFSTVCVWDNSSDNESESDEEKPTKKKEKSAKKDKPVTKGKTK